MATKKPNDDIELLRFTTCGSVDDGKSTLIGRLLYDSKSIFEDQLEALERYRESRGEGDVNLANLTDGLRAEREQGITIDVAYRYFATPRRRFIVADSPGHIQYTRNMVTGASTASLALILVDARHGVIEQTKRHSYLASLLGIPHLVICVNKMDLVDYSEEVFEQIRKDYTRFSSKLSTKHITFVPISALEGDNVVSKSDRMSWYQGESLLGFLETVHIANDWNYQGARLPVQWVIRPQSEKHHDFRGFSGQVASGSFKKGDSVVVMPSGFRSKVKEAMIMEEPIPVASARMSATLLLEDEIDISRGDMIVGDKVTPFVEKEIDAMICWMAETPMAKGKAYSIKHTTNNCRVLFKDLYFRVNIETLEHEEADSLKLNEIGKVSLKASKELAFDSYNDNRRTGSFIIIDDATNQTVAAGMIIGPTKAAPVVDLMEYSI